MGKKLNFWVYTVLACVLTHLTWSFIFVESNNYSSLNYNWSKTKEIKVFENVVIDSVSENFLRLVTTKKLNVKPFSTYKIKNKYKTYFFRFNYSIPGDKEITFKDLIWLNTMPKIENKKFYLIEVDLPIKETKGVNVTTIGDDQIFQNEAKYFRKELRRINNVNFFGDKKDIYGFNYIGNKNLTFQYLNNNYLEVPKTEYYVIMLKPEDNIEIAYLNLKEFILKVISKKRAEKIILITLPIYNESISTLRDFNIKLINFSKENKNIFLVDSNLILKGMPNFYRKSINEISKEGYERLAKQVSKIL
tara:strand:+ start:6076 stop:6990 length:915 start_codon:yes stop_codon:yes gene_type:complete